MGNFTDVLNPPEPREREEKPSGKVPPHDLAAERSVLGGLLLDAGAMPLLAPIVQREDFYHPGHATIFGAAQAISMRGEPIDTVTIAHELRAREKLNLIGGAQYLSELADAIPTTAHIERYARIVAELAQVRRVILACAEIAAHGFDRPRDLAKYLGDASQRIMAATERRDVNEPKAIEFYIQRTFERIESALNNGQRTIGLLTGLDAIDNAMGGLLGGQLIIIAGRPGMGKSAIALNMAENIALGCGDQKPKHVLFFTIEMPGDEFAARSLAGTARVESTRLRTSMLSKDDMTALTNAAAKLYQIPLTIDESGSISAMDIRAKGMRAKQRGELDAIFVDYLQLMDHPDAERRDASIGKTTRALKQLAKQLNVPIVVLSQLNRSPETRPGKDRRPQLADLRESGDIEQDADVVMFVFRTEVYDKNTEDKGIAEIIIAKQRNGPTGTIRLRFVGELTKFENLAEEDRDYAPSHHEVDNDD